MSGWKSDDSTPNNKPSFLSHIGRDQNFTNGYVANTVLVTTNREKLINTDYGMVSNQIPHTGWVNFNKLPNGRIISEVLVCQSSPTSSSPTLNWPWFVDPSYKKLDPSFVGVTGINIPTITYFTTDMPFFDLVQGADSFKRPTTSSQTTLLYGVDPTTGNTISNKFWGANSYALFYNVNTNLDANGYPTQIDTANSEIYQSLVTQDKWNRDITNDRYYVILWDGQGDIRVGLKTPIVPPSSNNRIVIDLGLTYYPNSFNLYIAATNPYDYVRNIRIVPLSQENTYQTNVCRPDYSLRWNKFPVWRFMDFLETNYATVLQNSPSGLIKGSPIVNWSDRPLQQSYGLSGKLTPGQGGSYEDAIDLANSNNVSPWLLIPHTANDDFVYNFGILVKNRLNSHLRVYVELSNETWNSSFPAYNYFNDIATNSNGKYANGHEAYCGRALQIFDILNNIFADQHYRLIRVIGAQFTAFYFTNIRLNYIKKTRIKNYEKITKYVDVLAVAPYFGQEVCQLKTTSDANSVNLISYCFDSNTSVGDIANTIYNTVLPLYDQYIKNTIDIANSYGIPVVCYEAGEGLRPSGVTGQNPLTIGTKLDGVGNLAGNAYFVNKLADVNRHPIMANCYSLYYNKLISANIALLNWYTTSSGYAASGYWGLIESSANLNTPKYQTCLNIANSLSANAVNNYIYYTS